MISWHKIQNIVLYLSKFPSFHNFLYSVLICITQQICICKWSKNIIKSYMVRKLTQRVRKTQLDFNVTAQNAQWYGVRLHIATNLKETTSFWVSVQYHRIFTIIWKRLLKYYSLFQLHITVRLACLPVCQTKHDVAKDWVQKQIWESSYLLLSQSLLYKIIKQSCSYWCFLFWKIFFIKL